MIRSAQPGPANASQSAARWITRRPRVSRRHSPPGAGVGMAVGAGGVMSGHPGEEGLAGGPVGPVQSEVSAGDAGAVGPAQSWEFGPQEPPQVGGAGGPRGALRQPDGEWRSDRHAGRYDQARPGDGPAAGVVQPAE